jgi:2,4-dienoyl-CoA reductase-like NADH-dependent reductase (Old Yellow Enzyme family)
MESADFSKVLEDFQAATRRSLEAGFEVIELHMAHGYLFHEFLSPLSNHRTDEYGGSFENRIRFPLEVAQAVREVWPSRWPVFVRISASDWVDGGWDLPQSVRFCRALKEIGIDLIDCSSGGLVANAKIPAKPGYQLPFADAIRKEAKIATGAVGLITKAEDAERIIAEGHADAIFLAREFLRRPYWPLHAAHKLGVPVVWPKQYERGKIRD